MSRIIEPRTELLALISATGKTTSDLARETKIPRSRIENALSGYRPLSIDDLINCKNILRFELEKKNGCANLDITPADFKILTGRKRASFQHLQELYRDGILDATGFKNGVAALLKNRCEWQVEPNGKETDKTK